MRVTYNRKCSQLSNAIQSLAVLEVIGSLEDRYIILYNQLEEALRLIQVWEGALPVNDER